MEHVPSRALRPRLPGLVLACAAAFLGGCRTTRESVPPGLETSRIAVTHPLRAWNVIDAAGLRGCVVLFADPSEPERVSRRFYSVRNPWQQDLGTIDGMGRAWRFVPHRREAEWVATGTVLEGARAILAAGEDAELAETALAEMRAGGARN